jgi:broad specificity phosphatase PhoE
MGRRRRDGGIAAAFTSDLRRAAETAEIAFSDTDIAILYHWRLRECDFGTRNGSPAADVRLDRLDYCDRRIPVVRAMVRRLRGRRGSSLICRPDGRDDASC